MNQTTRLLSVLGLLLGVVLWISILLTYNKKLSEEIKEFPLEKVPENVLSQEVGGEIKENHGGRKGAIRPPKKLNVTGQDVYLIRNRTSTARLAPVQLYEATENAVTETGIVWSDFVVQPKEKVRTKSEKIDPNVIKSLRICSSEVVTNLTTKFVGKDFEWCIWALSDTGGKVKLGESYGTLTMPEQGRFDALGCGGVVDGKSFSCDEERGDGLIQSWRQNPSKGLCEDNAESKINCYDTPGGRVRYCMFENVMMSFKRMRKKVRADGSPSRSWEQGFLSASCGDKGKANIGYFPLYKPDIDGSSDAVCDYVFNETVLAYSHDNIRSFSHMFSDYMNMWSVLWLSGASQYTHDVSLLNIDAFRMGPLFDDQPSAYFKLYELAFRRILKAVDFGKSATVCFKSLLMQPRPEVAFTRDGWKQDLRCSSVGPSALYQRWNLNMRGHFGLLTPEAMPTNEFFSILLITKAAKIGNDRDNSPSARGIANVAEVVAVLEGITPPDGAPLIVIVEDFGTGRNLTFEQQVVLISSASVVIGLHGTGIAPGAVHMPVGSKYCCGMIEIFPASGGATVTASATATAITTFTATAAAGSAPGPVGSTASGSGTAAEVGGGIGPGSFKHTRGHGNMARRMGLRYSRLQLTAGPKGHGRGVYVPPDALRTALVALMREMDVRPSCYLPAVVRKPL